MKKLNLTILITAMILSLVGAVNAGMLIPANENAKEQAKAPEKSPVISETANGDWDLERVDFIHYAKPDNAAASKPAKGATQTCYKLMGVKWKTAPVNYAINPANADGLAESFVVGVISSAAENWDSQTSVELFNNTYTIDTVAQYGVRDNKNTIAFGNYSESNVIGVTSIWFIRSSKQIVEFDMLFNDSFLWGDAAASSLFMDLENIATHEMGHAVGMNDIYSQSCTAVTMYGYSGEGDIEKRTLEPADITGIRKIYGL